MTDGLGNHLGAQPGTSASAAPAPPEASPRHERLRALLQAHMAMAAELDLHAVLRRAVLAARELVDARYAALGVFGEDGAIDEFAHTGIDPATVERIGQVPSSCGIMALQAGLNGPVRLVDLRADPAFSGFPPHHPVMTGFLGMPIRIQDRAIGTLYVTDSASGEFSAEDEQLVVSLAGVAAVAIDNARRRRRSELRDRWSTVSTDVSRQLLAGHGDHSLELILRSARDTAAADFATLALLVEPGQLQVKATIGAMADGLVGRTAHTRGGLVGPLARTRSPVLVDGPDGATDAADVVGTLLPARVGSFIIVPLTVGGTVTGTLNVGRVVGAPAFTTADTGHLAGFAGQVGIAMELDHARAHRPVRHVTEDHDRLDTDLHPARDQRAGRRGAGPARTRRDQPDIRAPATPRRMHRQTRCHRQTHSVRRIHPHDLRAPARRPAPPAAHAAGRARAGTRPPRGNPFHPAVRSPACTRPRRRRVDRRPRHDDRPRPTRRHEPGKPPHRHHR